MLIKGAPDVLMVVTLKTFIAFNGIVIYILMFFVPFYKIVDKFMQNLTVLLSVNWKIKCCVFYFHALLVCQSGCQYNFPQWNIVVNLFQRKEKTIFSIVYSWV